MSLKVMSLDIEATNLNANFGFMICVGYKWLGQKKLYCPSVLDWPKSHKANCTDDKQLCKAVHAAMSEADVITTYYGTKFDIPYLNARFMYHGLPQLPPFKHLDLYYTARSQLKLHSRRLATVSQWILGQTRKTALRGDIWVRAAAGHVPSIRYIVRHCKADIQDLEDVYIKLRPYIKTHPQLGRDLGECRYCGSKNLIKRGFAVKRTGKDQRVSCKDCGGYDLRTLAQAKKFL